MGKFFVLLVGLIWVSNGLLPCCELFSKRPADHHNNFVMADNHHETQEPDSSPPIPCELMEEHSAVVTDSTPKTKIVNSIVVDCISARFAIVAITYPQPSILLTVYHPPPPSPYFLRTSRLLI